MATLISTKITESGTSSGIGTSYADTNGDEFSNTGIEFIHIQNAHASGTYTVRVNAQTTSVSHPTYGSVTKSNTDYTLTNGAEAYIGPFKQGVWSDSNNKVQLTYRTTATYSTGSALSTIGGGSTHKLSVQVLYLES